MGILDAKQGSASGIRKIWASVDGRTDVRGTNRRQTTQNVIICVCSGDLGTGFKHGVQPLEGIQAHMRSWERLSKLGRWLVMLLGMLIPANGGRPVASVGGACKSGS